MSSSKVWLITGCSSGLGRELARAALAHGDKVIATGRNITRLVSLKAAGAATLALDINAGDADVQIVIDEALKLYGRIDILVNNAAYTGIGAIEEWSDEELKALYETNFFGQLRVIRAVLPHMRSRKSGVIANIGSLAAWKGVAGAGLYCSAKFALVGATEALQMEVADLGIEVTVIELGYFRTNILSDGNSVRAAKSIDDYRSFMDPMKKTLAEIDMKQPGDPAKAAQLVVEALTKSGRCKGRTLPLRLPLGSDTVPFIRQVLEKETQSVAEWADIVSTTDHDDVVQSRSERDGSSKFHTHTLDSLHFVDGQKPPVFGHTLES